MRVEGFRGLAVLGLLEGSWVVISGVISPLIWVIMVTLLLAPLITTHEPLSADVAKIRVISACRLYRFSDGQSTCSTFDMPIRNDLPPTACDRTGCWKTFGSCSRWLHACGKLPILLRHVWLRCNGFDYCLSGQTSCG